MSIPPGSGQYQERMAELLRAMVDQQASDLHLVANRRPVYRVHGRLHEAGGEPLGSDEVRAMLTQLVPGRLRDRMLQDEIKEMDFSTTIDHEGKNVRFRANVFCAQGTVGGCFRLIPGEVPTLEWTRFPSELAERIIRQRNGLVLLTGVAGSGKTTTLAVLVNMLNERGNCRIITIEEPIEYVFPPAAGSVVTQREVGVDTNSFYDGLRSALRQDPNVILVGEIRDRETAQMALSAAETGHLIFATLHTRDAKGAVTRITDLFPRDSQDDVRTQLALSLRFVISQHLLPSAIPAERRQLALEVLYVNSPVRSGIRFGKIETIDTALQTGRRDGMMTLDEHLTRLVTAGRITPEVAQMYANDPATLSRIGPMDSFGNV
ncbi:MAG: PilT/PilU family type 4a pilus ATPase [Phycisphaerae bacterium]|nr:PilT/PilU family type 4a pilus ATPase [Phycisphaerae bacterium]